MKFVILTSALTAAFIAAAPAPASAGGVSVGISSTDGRVFGHLVIADHRDRYYRDHRRHRRHGHGRHGHGRRGRCQSWRFVHRKLHRRFDHVRLQRRFHNRRGDRIFVARARNHRGWPVRVRYNACRGRIMKVTPIRHHRRHGWYR